MVIVKAYKKDSEERENNKILTHTDECVYIEYSGHRTRDFNQYMEQSKEDVLVFSDVDVVINRWQLEQAYKWCESGCVLAYPYNKMRKLGENSNEFFGGWDEGFFGGIFVVNRLKYMALGGENENLIGWGAEDMERYTRIKKLTSSEPPRVENECSHLWHPRVEVLNNAVKNNDLFNVIHKMNKDELMKYVDTFEWRQRWIQDKVL